MDIISLLKFNEVFIIFLQLIIFLFYFIILGTSNTFYIFAL